MVNISFEYSMVDRRKRKANFLPNKWINLNFVPNSADRWQPSGSIFAISLQSDRHIGCWTISFFPIKKSSTVRRWLSEQLLKRFNMQMTALECYRGGQRSRHEISAAASFFQKKFFQSHRWRVIFIILSVQLCAEQQNCSSCNWKNEQTNKVFSWKASSLGSASSISRKSVWDDSLLILRK